MLEKLEQNIYSRFEHVISKPDINTQDIRDLNNLVKVFLLKIESSSDQSRYRTNFILMGKDQEGNRIPSNKNAIEHLEEREVLGILEKYKWPEETV